MDDWDANEALSANLVRHHVFLEHMYPWRKLIEMRFSPICYKKLELYETFHGRIQKIQKEGAEIPLPPPNENFTFQDMQQ